MMTVDVRIIYIILGFMIAFPLFQPFGLPVAAERPAEVFYEKLASLPAGSPVIFSFDLSNSGKTELMPMVKVLVELSLQKHHKIILMGLWAEGANLGRTWADEILEKHNAIYGVDYIDWGYVPSYSAFMEAARIDLPAAVNGGVDLNRERLDTFPIMEGVKKASDIAAVCTFGTGDPGYTHWMQFWRATGEVNTILAGQVAVNTPPATAQFNAGNLDGLAGGLNGAATLELMHGIKGTAHGNSDAQSFGHLTIVIFLILGNIGYFGAKSAGEVK